jgi:two-component system NtrC family sensor kinase
VDDQIRKKDIHIKKRYESSLPQIIMDTHQIKQVFTNLFTNAIEAMSEGGILGIRTEPGKDNSDQTYVRIVVSDTGVGIPEDGIRRVFDPFFTTKNSDGNTGLGLSITKGIIDKHYGTIDIQSEPGRGTRVTIELPTGMV